MTRTTTIKNPSKEVIKIFDTLRDRKQQQIQKLSEKSQCTFTINV